jgi:glycosyltransferase involved in cell wall biosynthesis
MDKLLEGQLQFMSSYLDIVAVSSDKTYLSQVASREGVRSHAIEMSRTISPIKDFIATCKMYRFLKKEKPEMIHSHTPKAGIVSMLAARLAGVPLRLHTVAGLPLMEASGIKRSILNLVERLTYSCATQVLPNSQGLVKFVEDHKFAKPSKISMIGNGSSNGIDTTYFNPNLYDDNFRTTLRNELSIEKDSFTFIFVGRIVADKGIHELVDSFLKIYTKNDKVTLLLVGAFEPELDPIKEDVLEIIESHPAIKSVGFKNDVRPYFAISQALVFPSYREGFPNVVMQAGSMGLPSIVSDINGCNEIIIESVNGLIIPVKDVEKLTEAMKNMLSRPLVFEEKSSEIREMIVQRFERKIIWDALLKKYQELIGYNQK